MGVGGVVVRDNRVLVVRRATEPLKGEWSIPGGVLEIGEKLREGVAREVFEETGLSVQVGEVLDVFDSIFPDEQGAAQYHYVLIDYVCFWKSGEPMAASDVSEVRWISGDELTSLGMKSATEQVIRKALARASESTSKI